MTTERSDLETRFPPWATRGGLVVAIAVVAVALLAFGINDSGSVNAAANPQSSPDAADTDDGGDADADAESDTDDAGDTDAEEETDPEGDTPSGDQDPGTALSVPEDMPTEKPETLGKALDPLSSDEAGYARYRAIENEDGMGQQLDGSVGYEFLYVDVANPDPDSPHRIAAVVSYDYAENVTVFQYVNVETGEVEVKKAADVALAPSDREAELAMELLIAAPEGEQLRRQYEDYMDAPLESPNDLRFVGGAVFAAAGVQGIADCETHRCVEFQVQVPDGRVLETGPVVVDLSARTVLTED